MKKISAIFCLYFCFSISSIAHAELLSVHILANPYVQDRIVQLILTDVENTKAAPFDIHGAQGYMDFNLLIDWEAVIVRVITSSHKVHDFRVDRIGTNQLFEVLYLGDGKFEVRSSTRRRTPKVRDFGPPENLFTISNKSVVPMNELRLGH